MKAVAALAALVLVASVWLLMLATRRAVDAPVPAQPQAPAQPARPEPEVTRTRPAPLAATSEATETALGRLRASGEAREVWASSGMAILDTIARRAARTGGAGCYVAGCGATFTFGSAEALATAHTEVERSADYRAWTGGKLWTSPEPQPDGSVETAVLLYRPD
jgi:hypothetical protein